MDVNAALDGPAAGEGSPGRLFLVPAWPEDGGAVDPAEVVDATAEELWEVLPDWQLTGWGRALLADSWLEHRWQRCLTAVPTSLRARLRGSRMASTTRAGLDRPVG